MKYDISNITTYQSGVMQSTSHRVMSRIKTNYLSQYDLTAMQWFVIGFVYDSGDAGIRLSKLMKILGTTMPFITTIVNMLSSKGIIEKTNDVNDSRVKIARLNPEYRSMVEDIEDGLREELRRELYSKDNISREELQTYVAVIYKMSNDANIDIDIA